MGTWAASNFGLLQITLQWTERCLLYFSDYKTHLSPQIWEEKGGMPYSPNVAYIYIGEILCYLCY